MIAFPFSASSLARFSAISLSSSTFWINHRTVFPTHTSFQGAGIPALAIKTVVDEMYVLDPEWGEVLHKTGTIPVMRDTTATTDKKKRR